jgi:hypothetical protein
MSATNQRDQKRRHVRVEAIQNTITETPSEGIMGIGVKLALANFLDGFDEGGEPAVSAYLDAVRMLDRDFLAEAEAVVERSKDSRKVVSPLRSGRSRQVEHPAEAGLRKSEWRN